MFCSVIKNKEQMTPGIDTNMPALPDITLLKKLLRSEVDMLASIKNNFQVFIFLCFVPEAGPFHIPIFAISQALIYK